jgi:2-methylisocitrate lyase-like PEP mutase family enzyme
VRISNTRVLTLRRLTPGAGCGHTKGKSVVPRAEAIARIEAAVDARNTGQDIVILAQTDALIHGWEEVEARVCEFVRIGVDFVFIEALPDRETMHRAVKAFDIPVMANIIEGGKRRTYAR